MRIKHQRREYRKHSVTDLRTFSGHALSFQPALDAGEAEEMSAAQGGQTVLARRRPRLEADGADVAFALFGLRRLKRGRGRGDQLQVDRRTGSGYRDEKTSNYRFKMIRVRHKHSPEAFR